MTGIWSDAGLSRARHFALATVAAVILTLMAVADAGAAAPVTFGESEGGGLQLGSACLNGKAPADTPIRIVWKSASGRIKARVDTTSNLGGGWDYCSETKHLRVGDTTKAVVNGTKRTVTMPKVTIASDRSGSFTAAGRRTPKVTCGTRPEGEAYHTSAIGWSPRTVPVDGRGWSSPP
jgi:hypothetical protein